MNKPILPRQLGYASQGEPRPRTRSGFGVASLMIGCVVALAVLVGAPPLMPWTPEEGNRIALATLPFCAAGAAFGIAGSVRRTKRRLPGVLGLLINSAVAVGVGLLWLATHVPT